MSAESPLPRDLTGKTNITITWRIPDEKLADLDEFQTLHQEFMRATHPTEGEEALLYYSLSRCREHADPLDHTSEETGFTLVALNEIYETPAGVAMHMREAYKAKDEGSRSPDIFMDFMATCLVHAAMGVPVNSSYTGGPTAEDKPRRMEGKCAVTWTTKVAGEHRATFEKLMEDHREWVVRTAPTSGDEALLHYALTMNDELENPMDPTSAKTGNIVATLQLVFATPAGQVKHMQLLDENKAAGGTIKDVAELALSCGGVVVGPADVVATF